VSLYPWRRLRAWPPTGTRLFLAPTART
jgi:hypothetical protein